ncbi:MAG TPA: adenosylcobinamide-GDP ribazoletransferase [Candidatus Elarobacter sp.]
MLRALRSAFAYFSVLPVGTGGAPDAAALAWLPFVGAAAGALAGFAGALTAAHAPHALAVAVAFGATIVLTGAVHLDGFLDGCDAFFAPVPVERRFAILKDPGHGTFALAGIAVAGAFWVAALSALAAPALPLALACAAASARWGAILHALYVPYGGATASAFVRRPPFAVLVLGLALVVALAWPLGPRGAVAAVVALATSALAVTWVRGRLGGAITGDGYGFAITVAEVSALVTLAV